jgi:hypothetical protein
VIHKVGESDSEIAVGLVKVVEEVAIVVVTVVVAVVRVHLGEVRMIAEEVIVAEEQEE